MSFPSPKYANDPLGELYYFDYDGLTILVRSLPDPVIARMTCMANMHVRGNLFGALDPERKRPVEELIQRESSADPEKDKIVIDVVVGTVRRMLQEHQLKKEDLFYYGIVKR